VVLRTTPDALRRGVDLGGLADGTYTFRAEGLVERVVLQR